MELLNFKMGETNVLLNYEQIEDHFELGSR